jgi:hypothetical protein
MQRDPTPPLGARSGAPAAPRRGPPALGPPCRAEQSPRHGRDVHRSPHASAPRLPTSGSARPTSFEERPVARRHCGPTVPSRATARGVARGAGAARAPRRGGWPGAVASAGPAPPDNRRGIRRPRARCLRRVSLSAAPRRRVPCAASSASLAPAGARAPRGPAAAAPSARDRLHPEPAERLDARRAPTTLRRGDPVARLARARSCSRHAPTFRPRPDARWPRGACRASRPRAVESTRVAIERWARHSRAAHFLPSRGRPCASARPTWAWRGRARPAHRPSPWQVRPATSHGRVAPGSLSCAASSAAPAASTAGRREARSRPCAGPREPWDTLFGSGPGAESSSTCWPGRLTGLGDSVAVTARLAIDLYFRGADRGPPGARPARDDFRREPRCGERAPSWRLAQTGTAAGIGDARRAAEAPRSVVAPAPTTAGRRGCTRS